MRFVFYTHSLVSDWNHGNAHFLRGIMRDLVGRGHTALALEPADSWSRQNLVASAGEAAVVRFAAQFPDLQSEQYAPGFDHAAALDSADVVVVHEWTDPALVAAIGALRRDGAPWTLIFHDTHHRAVSSTGDIAGLDLSDYDGVLAFGETLRQRYLDAGWGDQVFTWHEAADTSIFHPHPDVTPEKDLVWIGNWGDDERTAEIGQFLIEPAKTLGLTGTVRGVRYPDTALTALGEAGLDYRGWIANSDAPLEFARHRLTVHIPRRPYIEALPGIPTIRMFEALACGIPLISAPWPDVEGLFRANTDFLFAHTGADMTSLIRDLLADPERRREQAAAGLETILARHTCHHRVDELLAVLAQIGTSRVTDKLSINEAAQ